MLTAEHQVKLALSAPWSGPPWTASHGPPLKGLWAASAQQLADGVRPSPRTESWCGLAAGLSMGVSGLSQGGSIHFPSTGLLSAEGPGKQALASATTSPGPSSVTRAPLEASDDQRVAANPLLPCVSRTRVLRRARCIWSTVRGEPVAAAPPSVPCASSCGQWQSPRRALPVAAAEGADMPRLPASAWTHSSWGSVPPQAPLCRP